MELSQAWRYQILYGVGMSAALTIMLVREQILHEDAVLCSGEPYSDLVEKYMLLVVGANASQWFNHLFRPLFGSEGFQDDSLRHRDAFVSTFTVNTIMLISAFCCQQNLLHNTCVSFVGVRTSPFLWIDWLLTIPLMFFMVNILDLTKITANSTSFLLEIMGGVATLFLFFGHFDLPYWLHIVLFVLANILMCVALGWQLYESYIENRLAREDFYNIIEKERNEIVLKERHDHFRITQCKFNCSLFMTIVFTLFPILYYIQIFQVLDDEVFILILYSLSYVSKALFMQILSDSHMELLDPNKFLLFTERRKAEESRLAFLRYVFHEVRVPLNSVSLGIQLLFDSEQVVDEDRETVAMIREATGFMAETLNDVLSLQKIEEGKLELESKPFKPSNLIKSVLTNFRGQFQEKQVRVNTEIAENVPHEVLGDQFRLEHVLGNIVSNAIKFSDTGGEVKILVTKDTANIGEVCFSVIDQGPGISPEDQDRLFQPFMQIRPGELQKGRGSGLGLSICKNIISLHNGSIGCHSRSRVGNDPGGSEFYFSIKFAIPESDEDMQKSKKNRNNIQSDYINETESISNMSDVVQDINVSNQGSMSFDENEFQPNVNEYAKRKNKTLNSQESDKASRTTRSVTKKSSSNDNLASSSSNSIIVDEISDDLFKVERILVCDDVKSNRKMLDLVLQKKGYKSDLCEDGEEAVALVKEKGIDYFHVIFMDSIMPNMTGPEASRVIRAMGYSNLIVGVTGNAMDVDITNFQDAGADIILTKPVKINGLNKLFEYCGKNGPESFRNKEVRKVQSIRDWMRGK